MHLEEIKIFNLFIGLFILFFVIIVSLELCFLNKIISAQLSLLLSIFSFFLFILFVLTLRKKIIASIEATHKNEHKYKALTERFYLALDGANEGLWDWNIKEGTLYFSPRWKEMLGYKDSELENSFETWESRVHPDDIDMTKKMIELSHANPDVEYRNIHRLRHKDGHWVWILDRGQTLFDEKGNPIRMLGFHTDISEQKMLENELHASQEQFEQFMKYIPANIYILKNSKIVYANRSASAFFGERNIINSTAEDLLCKKDAEVVQYAIDKALQDGVFEDVIEVTNYQNERRIFRILTFTIERNSSTRVGFVGIDITTEYKDRHDLVKFKKIIETSPVSMVITDVDGNIEYVNPWFCQTTGYSYSEAIGQNPKILKSDFHPKEDYIELWEEITHNHVWSGTFKNVKKSGEEYWESAIIAPIKNESGLITNYIGIKQEISEQVYLRQELIDKEEIMIAQSRHAAMGEMIGMIAHQWRQPISIIAMGVNNMLVDIKLEELSQETFQAQAESILYQTEYLSKTIDDFRNFFRQDKEIEEVQLADIMQEANKIIGASLQDNNIALHVQNRASLHVKTYSRELLQVYINLLKNAKEAIVENSIKEGKISVVISENNQKLITQVCDNGGGIDKEIIAKIFDPYFSTKDEKTGTGLGLYMSKTIIEKHLYGTIKVVNTQEGACFTLEIPSQWGDR